MARFFCSQQGKPVRCWAPMVEYGIEDRTHPITAGFWYVFGIMKY